MAVTLKGQSAIYEGTSTDTKPTDADNNAIFKELDTGIRYYYDGTDWNEIPSSGGGGGGTGTDNYNELNNKPSINGTTLSGNKSLDNLGIQAKLTFDSAPTEDSENPVKSGGVYSALAGKQDTISDLSTIRRGAAAGATAVQPTTLETALAGKQDALSSEQLDAVNSGITSADVEQITTNKNNISSIKEKTDNIMIDSNRNIYIQATAPTGTIPVGSTWISGGSLKGYVQESNVSTATIEQGTFNADGSESPNNSRVRTTFDTDIYSMGAYTVSITGANDVLVFVYDSDKTCIRSEGSDRWKSLPYSFNLAGDRYVRFAFRKTNDRVISPSDVSNYALAFQGWK